MLYAQNGARPSLDVFEKFRDDIPNFSMRMHELTAAVARPQIKLLAERSDKWVASYRKLAELLDAVTGVSVPDRGFQEAFVPSSIQFSLKNLDKHEFPEFLDRCKQRGVDIKWFGSPEAVGFTSAPHHWRYTGNRQLLRETVSMLDSLCDIRIPQSLNDEDCANLVQIIVEALPSRFI
jgi:dTDP-4-amino-4,6-dideoxygalactose transaminase